MLYKHIFRNALIPLVTGFPAAFIGAFFTGALLIETLFSLDGLGLLSYESVVRRDYPVVLGSLYLFTLIALVVKLVSDLLYMVVDPRVQFASVGREVRARQPWTDMSAVLDTPIAAPPAAAAKPQSPNQRAWARFTPQPAGLPRRCGSSWPCWCWPPSPSCSATTARWWRASTASGTRRCSATPAKRRWAATSTRPPTGRTRSSPSCWRKPGNWALITFNPHSADSIDYFSPDAARRARPAPSNWLGTDSKGRDMLARLVYGFRVSVWFALALTITGTLIGIAAGALQGYFGGRVDLFLQRFVEIWGAVPELYLLIIFASIFEPSLLLLLILLSLWGWIGLSDYVRAEFLRNRELEYVKAARALGLSNWQIIRAPRAAQFDDAGDHLPALSHERWRSWR